MTTIEESAEFHRRMLDGRDTDPTGTDTTADPILGTLAMLPTGPRRGPSDRARALFPKASAAADEARQ